MENIKQMFPHFFRDLDITKSLVFLDTNVLLQMYSWSEQKRKEFLSTLDKTTVIIPYYVLEEFTKNWPSARNSTNTPAKELIQKLEDNYPQLKEAIKKVNSGIIEDHEKRKKEIEEWIFTKYLAHPDLRFTKNIEEDIIQKGIRRFADKIPPGYCDDGKEYPFGDLFIWAKILHIALTYKKEYAHIIFITNDVKEDWYYEKKYLRKELHEELASVLKPRNINVSLWGFTSSHFIDYINGSKNADDNSKNRTVSLRVTEEDNKLLRDLLHIAASNILSPVPGLPGYNIFFPTGSVNGPTGATNYSIINPATTVTGPTGLDVLGHLSVSTRSSPNYSSSTTRRETSLKDVLDPDSSNNVTILEEKKG